MKAKYLYPVIAILFGYIIFLHSCHLPDIKKEVETTTNTYTEIVDSLGKEIFYWKSIPPDIIRDTVDVPVPVPAYVNGDTLNEYNSAYTDSIIVARWTQQIAGELKSQEFEYFLKRKQVTERIKYRTKTVTTETITTITNTITPSGYVSVGGFAGYASNKLSYGPSVAYTSNNQTTFFVNYDASNGGIYGGARVKLKLFNF